MAVEILHRYTRAVLYSSATADTIAQAVVEANLRWANLRGANLRGANLRWANLRGAECGTAFADILRITGTYHALIAVDADNVSVGCIRNTLAWWRENYAEVGRKQSYSDAQIEEYLLHIQYVAQWFAVRRPAA